MQMKSNRAGRSRGGAQEGGEADLEQLSRYATEIAEKITCWQLKLQRKCTETAMEEKEEKKRKGNLGMKNDKMDHMFGLG